MKGEVSMADIRIKEKMDNKLDGKYYTLDQEMDFLQMIFCCFCEASNRYEVAQSDPNFSISNNKGYIKQQSDCLSRVLCICNRPFEAKLRLFNEDIAIAQRPCRCCLQWMPCQQNELIVTTKTGRIIGYIRVGCWCIGGHFFSCADAQMQIFSGENDNLLYTVEGQFCQKSLLCPFFRFCYCPNIQYAIFDGLNLKVGKILNLYNGCFSQMLSRTDKFGIQFPSKAEQDHKILLLYAAMYLDYLRFQTPAFCGGFR